ncbi:MAG: transporter substrate-binding domain-containing protein [Burkholderiaceae bacterium]|nr:transporter substrate-binding domain-containing protein [Roseateles sp.]MBV8471460.1 transporter substrate-binding domain-containing protein [Burkholderiaceae bacterium]
MQYVQSAMRNRLLALGLLFCIALGHPARAERLLVLGAEDYFSICYSQSGHPAGIFPQILQEVSKISGDQYDLQLYPWKRAQAMATTGQGGIAHFSWTEERARIFDFSDPVVADDIQLWVKKGNEFNYKLPRDLKGHMVGAKDGASFGQAIDELMAKGEISVDRDLGFQDRIRKLLLGRIDVAIVEGVHDYAGGSEGNVGSNGLQNITVLPTPLVHDPLYLAFPKSMNKGAALERFNKALAVLKKTARYRELTASP